MTTNNNNPAMSAMKASEDALLNEAKASAVANDAIIPRRPHRGGGWEGVYFRRQQHLAIHRKVIK